MTAPFSKKMPHLLLFGFLITTNYISAQEANNGKTIFPATSSICVNSIVKNVEEDLSSSSRSELDTTNEFIVELSAPNGSFAINSPVVNSSSDIDVECSKPTFALLNNPVEALNVNCKYDFSETFIDSLLFFDIDVIKERII
jgi:hypothetical protein